MLYAFDNSTAILPTTRNAKRVANFTRLSFRRYIYDAMPCPSEKFIRLYVILPKMPAAGNFIERDYV